MTGYGKSSYIDDNYELDIEVKSVNHRYLDLKLMTPRELNWYEFQMREMISRYIKRGKVEVRVTVRDKRLPDLEIDLQKLEKLWNLYNSAIAHLNVTQQISIEKILENKTLLLERNQDSETEEFTGIIDSNLEDALKRHEEMALREGESMQDFFVSSLSRITSALNTIESEFPEYKNEIFLKYNSQIASLLQKTLTEEEERRLMLEAAVFVEKADINEEIVRLKDHIEKFREKLYVENAEIGKSMNFILLEMQREANTISAKFNSSKVFSQILTIKEEIEKCRELVQNVE